MFSRNTAFVCYDIHVHKYFWCQEYGWEDDGSYYPSQVAILLGLFDYCLSSVNTMITESPGLFVM